MLGICVGMQVLFDAGVEHGEETAGLGVLRGRVEPLQAPVLPHMGWNTVTPAAGSVLFAGLPDGTRFYFVHSYAAHDTGGLVTTARHGEEFVAAVEDGVDQRDAVPSREVRRRRRHIAVELARPRCDPSAAVALRWSGVSR